MFNHEGRHQPRRPHDVEQVVIHPKAPVVVRDRKQVPLWTVARGVDQDVDSTPSVSGRVDEAVEIVWIEIAPGVPEPSQFVAECFSTPGRRHDAHDVSVGSKPSRCACTDTRAAANDQSDLLVARSQRWSTGT